MSMGTPVITYRSRGVQEVVAEGKTGLFYEQNNPEEFEKTTEKIEKLKINREECQKQAGKFSKEKFVAKIKAFLE